MDILDKIKKLSTVGNLVGVFVSHKSTLEVVQFDYEKKQILKHAQTELPYDLVTRQISDFEALEAALQDLFSYLDISKNTPVVMTLPTIFMSQMHFPEILKDEVLEIALVSEAEKGYIFKKTEPKVSWETISVNSEITGQNISMEQYVLYSAIQKDQIDQIEDLFSKLGMNLIAIDTSYTSLVRGLAVSGLVNKEIYDNKLWCIFIVDVNWYTAISLVGNKIIDISETPLAIRSFNSEDVYPTIASYSMEIIETKSPDHIVFISETNDISAEILSTYFDLSCTVSFIEENNYNKQPLFLAPTSKNVDNAGDLADFVSLISVGTACWKKTDIPISFNFGSKTHLQYMLYEFNILGKSFSISPLLIQYGLFALIGVTILSVSLISIIFWSIKGALDIKLQDSNTRLTQVKQEKMPLTMHTADNSEMIKAVYENNGKIVSSFSSIGGVIPEKLWIESLEIHNNLGASMTGKADSVDDIVNYYQNLIRVGKFAKLKIKSIRVIGNVGLPDSKQMDVKIIPKNENEPDFPKLPNISQNSQDNYYEFTFGE